MKAKCRDDPIFNEGIRKMIAEIINLSIVEYINAIIFIKKNKNKDPLDSCILEKKWIIKDCERFFIFDYEYMTGKDGEKAMEQCRTVANKRKSYMSREWIKGEYEHNF